MESLKKRWEGEHIWVEAQVIRYIEEILPKYKKDPTKYREYIDRFIINIEKNIYPHHKFEEDEIFPYFKDKDIIKELIKEHRTIEDKIENIKKSSDINEKIKLLISLLDILKRHIKKEDTEILPLLK